MSDEKQRAVALDQAEQEVGKRLLEVCVEQIKRHGNWDKLNESQQKAALDRMRDEIDVAARSGMRTMLGGGYPAARASLDKVVFSDKGVQCALTVEKGAGRRHELADFAGREVIVVLAADFERYLSNMELVKADPDQASLHLAFDGELDEDQQDLLEMLANNNVVVPAGILVQWAEESVAVVREWLERGAKRDDLPAFLRTFARVESLASRKDGDGGARASTPAAVVDETADEQEDDEASTDATGGADVDPAGADDAAGDPPPPPGEDDDDAGQIQAWHPSYLIGLAKRVNEQAFTFEQAEGLEEKDRARVGRWLEQAIDAQESGLPAPRFRPKLLDGPGAK